MRGTGNLKRDLRPAPWGILAFGDRRADCATSGHSPTAWRTGRIDPERTSRFDIVNGRNALRSGRLRSDSHTVRPDTRNSPLANVSVASATKIAANSRRRLATRP